MSEDGLIAWGSNTLPRKPTAMDRVSIRRLMFVLEKRIREATREVQSELAFDYEYDLNKRFPNKWLHAVMDVLDVFHEARGLDRSVIYLREVRPDYFKADIEVKAKPVLDFIKLNFVVQWVEDDEI